MKFGLSSSEFDYLEKELILPLKKCGAKVWIFGSRARGDQQKFSDIDLMVDCANEISTLLAELREKFIHSNFRYKIDIVELKNFAKSYLPGFEKEKKLL